jgi:hypothetical protein
MTKKRQLYQLLYEWLVNEGCDMCKHLSSFRDEDKRHTCNRCEYYNLFKLKDEIDGDLKDKVKLILEIVK